jgi:sigma-54 dependent transcriptional regulator, acetoin dehydrogenase operon transcriptional activator AcoR
MSRGARLRPEVTGHSRLARARERFLTAEPIEPGQVREMILASWRRSREWHVAADRIDLSHVRDPDLDTPLTPTALPVLQNLHENLSGRAGQRHPHRCAWGGAVQADRRPRS